MAPLWAKLFRFPLGMSLKILLSSNLMDVNTVFLKASFSLLGLFSFLHHLYVLLCCSSKIVIFYQILSDFDKYSCRGKTSSSYFQGKYNIASVIFLYEDIKFSKALTDKSHFHLQDCGLRHLNSSQLQTTL